MSSALFSNSLTLCLIQIDNPNKHLLFCFDDIRKTLQVTVCAAVGPTLRRFTYLHPHYPGVATIVFEY